MASKIEDKSLVDISDEDVKVPVKALVIDDKKRVKIRNMADYADIFFAVEKTTYHCWLLNPKITDRDVISAFNSLIRDFDNQEAGTLAWEISTCVKAFLILRKRKKQRDYTLGEIFSCIAFLIKLAKQHQSSSGVGYLTWIRTFFEGRLPETREENLLYILLNEL